MSRERNTGLDLIKTVAIVGVVLAHVCSPGFYTTGFDFVATTFWSALLRMAVPLFLMCSGAVLLDPERELDLRRFYGRNYVRILVALFFWAAAYKVFHLALDGALSGPALLHAFKELLLFNHEVHLYFLHIILLIYLFFPVLRLVTKHASRNMLVYILCLWALTGIIYPTVRPFWPFRLLDGIPAQWMLNMAYASMGYCLLGYFLKRWPMKRRIGAVLFAVGFLITFFGTLWLSRETLDLDLLSGMSVGIALKAAGLYAMLVGARPKRPGFVVFVSKASFCIYLVHIFFIVLAQHYGWTVLLLPCAVSIPLGTVIVFAICCGVYFVLSKIPIVRTYLM
ncbi:MAG: acyltransferase family protein [Oscillospiraceae bacterium]|nr:acyltransferase family protein [Oscillospiraceae bacterium]